MTPMAMARGDAPTRPKKPIVAVEKQKACITPQDHVRRKMHNVQKKLDEIQALEVDLFVLYSGQAWIRHNQYLIVSLTIRLILH